MSNIVTVKIADNSKDFVIFKNTTVNFYPNSFENTVDTWNWSIDWLISSIGLKDNLNTKEQLTSGLNSFLCHLLRSQWRP